MRNLELEMALLNAENQKDIENLKSQLINERIRQKYSMNEEFAILRKYSAGIDNGEFAEYNQFVENIKAEIKAMMARAKGETPVVAKTATKPSVAVVRVVQEYPYVDKNGAKHNDKIRHYAVDDQGNRYYMECSGLIKLVDEAIDDFPCQYVYTATNKRVEQ